MDSDSTGDFSDPIPTADDRVVHGLLTAWGDHWSGRDAERLARAFAAIDGASLGGRRWPLAARVAASFALAASLLVALSAFVGDRVSAAQTLAWLEKVAAEPIDRRYRFAIKFRKPRPLGHTEVTGEFFVRGSEASLQRFRIGDDREVTIGRVRDRVWIMGMRGPVIVRDREDTPRWGPPADDAAPELLSVSAVLSKVKTGYQLEFGDSPNARSRRLVATSETPGGERADSATLDYDEATGSLLAIELRWSSEERPLLMRLDWEESTALPPDWYENHNHHGPDRPVIDRSTPRPDAEDAGPTSQNRPNRVPAQGCS